MLRMSDTMKAAHPAFSLMKMNYRLLSNVNTS